MSPYRNPTLLLTRRAFLFILLALRLVDSGTQQFTDSPSGRFIAGGIVVALMLLIDDMVERRARRRRSTIG